MSLRRAWYQGWAVVRKVKGKGRGHHGHKGRPGRRGGSLPGPGRYSGALGAALTRDGVDHVMSGHNVSITGRKASETAHTYLSRLGFSPETQRGRKKTTRTAAPVYADVHGYVNAFVTDIDDGVQVEFEQ